MTILPRKFRGQSVRVACTIFVRAVLNFAGLALMLPVLLLLLEPGSIHTNRWLDALYRAGGFSSDTAFALAVCGAVVGLILLKNALNLFLLRYERKYTYDLYRYLSRRLYVEYHDRGLGFIKNANSALLARNVNVVSLAFVTGVVAAGISLAGEGTLLVLLLVALFVYNPLVAGLILVIFVPAAWVYYRAVRKRLVRQGAVENEAQRDKARTVIETFRGYADLEIMGAFPSMLGRFDRAMDRIVAVRSKNMTIQALPAVFMEVGLTVGMVVLVVVGMQSAGTEMKVLFGVFAVAGMRLMPSMRNMMGAWTTIRYNRYTIDVLRETVGNGDPTKERGQRLLAVSAERGGGRRAKRSRWKTDVGTRRKKTSEAKSMENGEPILNSQFSILNSDRVPWQHAIEVRSVAFRFDDDGGSRQVFEELSLVIRKGERIGIRGGSGAGKTTLFNLLLGFYTPSEGEILIDGVALTPDNRRQWQNSVGYVSQHVFLADGTLSENIALGVAEEEIDRERVLRAVRAAQLEDFVASLSMGVDSPIGEAGNRLSGGQRQRIGIARALYKGADILFFDEATSALDGETEQEINRAIATLASRQRDLTIVVIAHRESSLEYCDRIITL